MVKEKTNLILISSFLTTVLSFSFHCKDYTTTASKTAPPILISMKKISTGYELVFNANNAEILFGGYRLFIGTTENEARYPSDLSSGIDCKDGYTIIPNQPITYSAEISPNDGGLAAVGDGENANRFCKYQVSLTSGQYVSLRSLLVSIQPSASTSNLRMSEPSNALTVP